MKLEPTAKRGLVPILLEWVHTTRIKPHLIPNTFFMMFIDGTLYFHLSNLSPKYQQKHILPDIQKYSKALLLNITPQIEKWCKLYHIHRIELEIIFSCEAQRYVTTKDFKIKMDDAEIQTYLKNKST